MALPKALRTGPLRKKLQLKNRKSKWGCAVPECKNGHKTGSKSVRFPNAQHQKDKFLAWSMALGFRLDPLSDQEDYIPLFLCQDHFKTTTDDVTNVLPVKRVPHDGRTDESHDLHTSEMQNSISVNEIVETSVQNKQEDVDCCEYVESSDSNHGEDNAEIQDEAANGNNMITEVTCLQGEHENVDFFKQLQDKHDVDIWQNFESSDGNDDDDDVNMQDELLNADDHMINEARTIQQDFEMNEIEVDEDECDEVSHSSSEVISELHVDGFGTVTDYDSAIKCINHLRHQLEAKEEEISMLKLKGEGSKISVDSFKTEDAFRRNTGLPNKDTFHELSAIVHEQMTGSRQYYGEKYESEHPYGEGYSTKPTKLKPEEMLLLTLLILRRALPVEFVGCLFGVAKATVSRIFRRYIKCLSSPALMEAIVPWVPKDVAIKTAPMKYVGMGISRIIDCFELKSEVASDMSLAPSFWSQYKHSYTVKYLVLIIPNGAICFISPGYTGRASDKFVTEDSGFLDKLVPNETVMADRGFNIDESLLWLQCKLYVPPKTTGRCQFLPEEVHNTKSVANKRICVENVICRIRDYAILKTQMEYQTTEKIDEIVKTICLLVNLGRPVQ